LVVPPGLDAVRVPARVWAHVAEVLHMLADQIAPGVENEHPRAGMGSSDPHRAMGAVGSAPTTIALKGPLLVASSRVLATKRPSASVVKAVSCTLTRAQCSVSFAIASL
jgi:hypothetical protein